MTNEKTVELLLEFAGSLKDKGDAYRKMYEDASEDLRKANSRYNRAVAILSQKTGEDIKSLLLTIEEEVKKDGYLPF